jgi:hypothetical protein
MDAQILREYPTELAHKYDGTIKYNFGKPLTMLLLAQNL